MFWELIATVFAGLGAAGIALAGRHLTAKRLPSWAVPVCAGLGMLGFQVYSEYSWFQHQSGLLPEGIVVVKRVQETTYWRPWSYVFPQTVRFMAVDGGKAAVNRENPDLVLADIYVFERRLPARRVPQVFHCAQKASAVFSENLQIPGAGETLSDQWHSLGDDHPLLVAVCEGPLTATLGGSSAL